MRHAVPGSRVRVKMVRRRARRLEARLEEVLDPGPHQVAARCAHFGTCGGCAFQNLEYERQLVELRDALRRALERAGLEVDVEPVVGAADPWHYRNKMDFTFGDARWVAPGEPSGVERSFALGLHVPGRFDKVLDVDACAIAFPEAPTLLATVRELSRRRGLEPWSTRRHTGLLRHLVLRKGFRTGELLVDLVTSSDADELVEPFVAEVLERHPEVTTLVQSVNTRLAATAIGERQRVHHGPGAIRERLGGLTFTISAASFFQTNTAQAERLLEMVREEGRCERGEGLLDLYCGAGMLGLGLARDCREVLGVEEVEAAARDARRNAALNGIATARFHTGGALDFLRAEGARLAPDVCVADPPRAGLHPEVATALGALGARRIVYVSCNPNAAVSNLAALVSSGYEIARVRPIDLFPHTPHVECVFTLDRR